MNTLKLKQLTAELLPDLLVIYNHTNDEGICWLDTDEPVTEREWPYVLLEAEKKLAPYPSREESHYICNLRALCGVGDRIELLRMIGAPYELKMEALLSALCIKY